MQPIEPAELSAYLDGELASNRAREVATALATDSALRAQYDAQASADVAWKSAAHAAQFTPTVQLEKRKTLEISSPVLAIILGTLAGLVLVSKANDIMGWSLVVHSIAFVIALPWIVRIVRDNQNQL